MVQLFVLYLLLFLWPLQAIFFGYYSKLGLSVFWYLVSSRVLQDGCLIKVVGELFLASDCSQSIIRVIFDNFSTAFDFIDHKDSKIVLSKFISIGC